MNAKTPRTPRGNAKAEEQNERGDAEETKEGLGLLIILSASKDLTCIFKNGRGILRSTSG